MLWCLCIVKILVLVASYLLLANWRCRTHHGYQQVHNAPPPRKPAGELERRSSIEEQFETLESSGAKEWKVFDIDFTHKYSEPLGVDLTIKAGGIGGHR